MAWAKKFIKKSARRAGSAVGRAAKRQVRRAAPSFLTPKSWDTKPKKTRSKGSKAKKTGTKAPGSGRSFALGRSLGRAFASLRGLRHPVLILPAASSAKEERPKPSSSSGVRRRMKGERTLSDPRFERSQRKYEERKAREREDKFRRDNDHLFDVRLPGRAARAAGAVPAKLRELAGRQNRTKTSFINRFYR